MKKILTIALLLIALTSQAQISDELTQDTIDLWIVPGCTKCITAAKMLSILTHLNDNKLHKDSVDIYAASIADTSQWSRDNIKGVIYPKNIRDYVGIGTDSPAHTLDVTGRIYTDSLQMSSPSWWMDGFRKQPYYMTELLYVGTGTYGTDPWWPVAISSGTSIQNGVAEHPGNMYFATSATTNSGYYITIATGSIAGITGGEFTNCIIMPLVQDSVTLRYGFHDTQSVTEPTDGVYIETVPDSVIKGKTATAGTRSTTTTGYTMTKNTWYRLSIVVNSDATRVDYYVYDMAGNQLWTDYLTTNIPPSQLTGHGFVATKQTNGSATGLKPSFVAIDYMDLYLGTLRR